MKITQEQIEQARSVDLLSYLRSYEPKNLKRCGNNAYCLIDHDSLKISNGKWYWFSRQIGSNNALDYLIKVRSMDFIPAVELLSGHAPINNAYKPSDARHGNRPSEKKDLMLPPKSANPSKAVAYLRSRGIDGQLIRRCMDAGDIYASGFSCVFVGRDTAGTPRFATKRSILSNDKQDVPGSDKRFGFALRFSGGTDTIAVCESAIDALSLATLTLTESVRLPECHILSLAGVASAALEHMLKVEPIIRNVILCLDSDKAGRDGSDRILALLQSDYGMSCGIMLPETGKDWNDTLLAISHTASQNCSLGGIAL
jgi:hypothetical protein